MIYSSTCTVSQGPGELGKRTRRCFDSARTAVRLHVLCVFALSLGHASAHMSVTSLPVPPPRYAATASLLP